MSGCKGPHHRRARLRAGPASAARAGRRRGLALALAASVLATAAGLGAQRAALDRLADRARSQHGARTGILVLDAADGRVLYHRDAVDTFAPASNMKVLGAAAVLHGLGADARVETRFCLTDGVLVVHASADPEWRRGGASDPEVVLPKVVAALRSQGVSAVRDVRLDHGVFTGPMRPPAWPDDQKTFSYCAPTGGLVLEDGCLTLSLAEGAGGAAHAQLLAPPVPAAFRGEIRIKKRGVWGFRDGGGHVVLHGAIDPAGLPASASCSVLDPARWFEAAVRRALRNGGVAIASDAPARTLEPYVHTAPLVPAVLRSLEDSSNFAAEQLLRVLGAATLGDGSLAGGVRAMDAELRGWIGRPSDGVVFADGSGLSRTNRVTPALMAATLRAVHSAPFGAVFADGLPLAGRTGSLEKRFRGTPLEGRLRAKTGWIAGASSLSGYLPGPEGRTYVFSILMKYDRTASGRNRHLKALQEEMCLAMQDLR